MSQENRASTVLIVGICILLTFLLLGAPPTLVLAQSEPIPISIQDLAIHPDELSILQGDTVVWTNHDLVIHTLWIVRTHDQSTYALSPPIPPEGSWTHTFTETGRYQYYSFHQLWVTGSLTVQPIIDDVAITQLAAPDTAAVGDTLLLNVTIQNEGNVPALCNVTTYANNTAIGTTNDIAISIGTNTTIHLEWDTSSLAPGNYTLTAIANLVPEDMDPTDNSYSTGPITLDLHDIAVTQIQSTPTSLPRGATVSINVTLINHGTLHETFNVTLYYDDTLIETRTDVSLLSGNTVTLMFSWDTTGVTEGSHSIRAAASHVLNEWNTANNDLTGSPITVTVEEGIPVPVILAVILVPVAIVAYYLVKRQ